MLNKQFKQLQESLIIFGTLLTINKFYRDLGTNINILTEIIKKADKKMNNEFNECDLYRVEIKTPRLGTLYIFLDKTIEEVEALKLGFKNETDLKLLISKQKR